MKKQLIESLKETMAEVVTEAIDHSLTEYFEESEKYKDVSRICGDSVELTIYKGDNDEDPFFEHRYSLEFLLLSVENDLWAYGDDEPSDEYEVERLERTIENAKKTLDVLKKAVLQIEPKLEKAKKNLNGAQFK